MITASHNLLINTMLLSLIVFTIIHCVHYISIVHGEIIPFPRQEIKDGIKESTYLDTDINPNLEPKQGEIYDNPMDVIYHRFMRGPCHSEYQSSRMHSLESI